MSKAPTTHLGTGFHVGVGLLAIGIGLIGYQLYRENQRIELLHAKVASRDAAIEEILGEVTRLRIEQSAGLKGTAGLLEKLRTYAPILVSSSVTDPDHRAAKKEMQAVLRAFKSIGKDAWQPIHDRFEALEPQQNFDELKWLLEAGLAVDPKRGIEVCKQVLLGLEKPFPRLRWHAATLMVEHDKALGQATLRRILLTESSRGINIDRAAAYGAEIPDKAAFAATGFNNFVVHYIRSGDAEMEDTLLMVMGRHEHDQITVQECVEELGRRQSRRAVEPIVKLYAEPPGHTHNPLFQLKCLDALHAILGKEARPFFTAELPKATTETVANHLKRLLEES